MYNIYIKIQRNLTYALLQMVIFFCLSLAWLVTFVFFLLCYPVLGGLYGYGALAKGCPEGLMIRGNLILSSRLSLHQQM